MPGPEENARRQKLVRDLLARFHVVLKIARVYEPGNRLVAEQLGPLFRILTLILHAEGTAVLRLHGNGLFFNRAKVRSDSSNQHIIQFFVSELASHGITAVAFSEGVSLEELTRLVVLLSAREAGRTISFEEAVRTLREAGVAHITLEANPPEDEEAGPYARLVKVYFLGIRMLREIIDQQKREGGFSIGLARRWMQAMIRHLEENESFCLGLTTM
ncbi:MAG: hypothetical protein PHI34_11505, partial [Acidobacteriota bacterium]|nr:hypothetical protein [Acidobacteriota bacterium]